MNPPPLTIPGSLSQWVIFISWCLFKKICDVGSCKRDPLGILWQSFRGPEGIPGTHCPCLAVGAVHSMQVEFHSRAPCQLLRTSSHWFHSGPDVQDPQPCLSLHRPCPSWPHLRLCPSLGPSLSLSVSPKAVPGSPGLELPQPLQCPCSWLKQWDRPLPCELPCSALTIALVTFQICLV